ncbi:MAG: hypothetical protein SGPRY_006791 [Prymnesium sp.]
MGTFARRYTQGCCQELLPPFELWLSHTSGSSDPLGGDAKCGVESDATPLPSGGFHLPCQVTSNGAALYVTLVLPGQERTLSIGEMEIYGIPPVLSKEPTLRAGWTHFIVQGITGIYKDLYGKELPDFEMMPPWVWFALVGLLGCCTFVVVFLARSLCSNRRQTDSARAHSGSFDSRPKKYATLSRCAPEVGDPQVQDEEQTSVKSFESI